jgi:hypothetical protein
MLVRQKPLHLDVAQDRFAEPGRDIGLEQPVAVLRKRRVVPHGIVDTETDEPAEHRVAIDLLDQLALGAHRV